MPAVQLMTWVESVLQTCLYWALSLAHYTSLYATFVDVFFFPAPFVYLAFIHCVVVSVMKLKTLQCKKRKQTTENERPLTLQEQPGLSVHAKCWVLKMT